VRDLRAQRVDQATAQLVFQDEVVLRQRANALYIDAAHCVVEALPQSQKSLLAVVESANERIRRTQTLAQLMQLFGDLLVLAAAACAAKPGPISAAVQAVQQDLEALGES
jgi:hypothetical protein